MIKLSILILLQYNLFLNVIRLTKMCDKAFNKSFLSFFIFLIDIQLRKCAKPQRTLFLMHYCINKKILHLWTHCLDQLLLIRLFVFMEKKIVTVFWWNETRWSRSYVDDCFFIFLSFKMLAWLFIWVREKKKFSFSRCWPVSWNK